MTNFFNCPQCNEKISTGVTALFVLDDLKCPKCGYDFRKARANLDETILTLLKKNEFLQAIKTHKILTGCDLKNSKEFVDSMAQKNNIPVPKSKCFIATACYGNPEEQEVWILRAFRDEVLEKTIAGKLFIRSYYLISPPIAILITHSEILKKILKKYFIKPLVNHISK